MASTVVTPGPVSGLVAPGQPRPLQPGEFALSQPPNLITFGLSEVGPPSPLYIQRDDIIGINFSTVLPGSEVITVFGRFLRASDGVIIPFQKDIPVRAANGQGISQNLTLGEGYLLSATATCQQAIARGQTYVQVYLTRAGANVVSNVVAGQVLFADYVTAFIPVGWPSGPILLPGESSGARMDFTVTNTGPTQLFNASPPVAVTALYRVAFVQCILTTSATVANRVLGLELEAFNSGKVQVVAPTAQVASTVKTYTFAVGIQNYTDGNGNFAIPLPTPYPQAKWTGSGVAVTANVTGFQTGDQFSAVEVLAEVWAAI